MISSPESAVTYFPTAWNVLNFSVIANAAFYFPIYDERDPSLTKKSQYQSSQCSLCSFLYPDPTLSYAKKDPFPWPLEIWVRDYPKSFPFCHRESPRDEKIP